MMFVGTAASTAPRISILIGNQNVPRNAIQIWGLLFEYIKAEYLPNILKKKKENQESHSLQMYLALSEKSKFCKNKLKKQQQQ